MVHGKEPPEGDLLLRVLVVGDTDGDAELLVDMLDQELPSAQVTCVCSLADALALDQDVDVVLADLSPQPDHGLEFVSAIHGSRPNVSVLLVNGPAERAIAMAAIDAGAGDYLGKGSYDASGLVTALLHSVQRARALARTRQGQELATTLVAVMEDPTCSIAADGTILAVNVPWRAYAMANGGSLATCGVGVDYLAVCDGAAGASSEGASEVADGLRAVLAGRSTRFVYDYPCSTPTEATSGRGEQWFSVRVLPQGNGGGAVVSHHDITSLKSVERELSRRAMYDLLTDLPNRALLADRLEQALADSGRSGHQVAVAFVALDHFKRINDSFGHATGDTVLVEVAERLTLRLRDGDTLARFSGDEFVVVWRDLKRSEDAMPLSERLAQAFDAPFLLSGAPFAVTASIGVSGDQWAETADELISAADAAMHEAKRRGRGQVQFFTSHLRDLAAATMRTGLSLRAAMHGNEFVLHYQPIVDLARGAVVGVEALIRWQHPTDGLIGPDFFIPVAEAEGLIVELGEWVLERAASQAARWYVDGLRLDMAVNVSTRQIAHPSLVPAISRVVRETGLDPRHLVLEVTESAVMEDAEAAAEVFNAITALGVSLAIDDFGTGYSSLVYLKRYLIGALKVDRSFTAGMGVYAEDDAIVASVIGLAKAVGGTCIAEGIETAEQYAALRSLNCGFGQGWLFGKAVPAEDLPDLILACEAKLASLQKAFPQENEQRDQSSDERDQTADRRDQSADERDQAADRRDLSGDVRDQAADRRDLSGDVRDQAADRRDLTGDMRDQAGDVRDQAGDLRDQAGDVRDQAADRRDLTGDVRDQAEVRVVTRDRAEVISGPALARRAAASVRTRASQDRREGAGERILAEHDRDSALAARGAGASARTLAEIGRDNSLADRGASARQRDVAPDGTGVYLPDAGLVQLEREMARARRRETPLVLAFIDVDRLKAINDSRGHPDGDRMLLEVARALGAKVRSYDLIVRPGGDGFVWALSGLSMAGVTNRLALVNSALADAPEPGLVRFGLAELQPGDSPKNLVERASSALRLTTP